MAWKQPRIKRLLAIGLGYGVGAAVGSIILLALNGGQPNSLPIFFVTFGGRVDGCASGIPRNQPA